jgi:hypothetical protein
MEGVGVREGERGRERWGVAWVFFGGALAWLGHLLGAALMAEWGCLAGWGERRWLGISAVAWGILVLSIAMFVVAVSAIWTGYRLRSSVSGGDWSPDESRDTRRFLIETGLRANWIYTFIIVAESIPILFYLSEC